MIVHHETAPSSKLTVCGRRTIELRGTQEKYIPFGRLVFLTAAMVMCTRCTEILDAEDK